MSQSTSTLFTPGARPRHPTPATAAAESRAPGASACDDVHCWPRCARGGSRMAWIQGKCQHRVHLVHLRATTCTCRPRCARGRSQMAWNQGKCRDRVHVVHLRATTCTCWPRCARGRSPMAWISGKCQHRVHLVHLRATTCACRPRCARGRSPKAWIQGKCRDRVHPALGAVPDEHGLNPSHHQEHSSKVVDYRPCRQGCPVYTMSIPRHQQMACGAALDTKQH